MSEAWQAAPSIADLRRGDLGLEAVRHEWGLASGPLYRRPVMGRLGAWQAAPSWPPEAKSPASRKAASPTQQVSRKSAP